MDGRGLKPFTYHLIASQVHSKLIIPNEFSNGTLPTFLFEFMWL